MADYFYGRSVLALCADGKARAVTPRRYCFDGSLAADTFFSVPAFTRVSGRTVRGFMRGAEGEELEDGGPDYRFHAYTYRKNAALLG